MAEELIKIEQVTKKYNENVIFEDLSLSIRKGEVVVIVGPSGCGARSSIWPIFRAFVIRAITASGIESHTR